MVKATNDTSQWPRPVEDYAYTLTLSDAEFAWEFLRRNRAYQLAYAASKQRRHAPRRLASGTLVWRQDRQAAAARKWGLCSFRRSRTARA